MRRQGIPADAAPGLDELGRCTRCAGERMVPVERDGVRYMEECSCMVVFRAQRALRRMGIPERFAGCTLDSYRPQNASQRAALVRARGVAEHWPLETRGLALAGPVGTGKTHLVVATLRALVRDRQAIGVYADMRELLRTIQENYTSKERSEDQILRPFFEADVVVFDEIGAASDTEWTRDRLEHILGRRYDSGRCTLLTTNYAIRPPGAAVQTGGPYAVAVRQQTLGDRIGARMLSRVTEMCHVVEVDGEDFRGRVGR